MNAPGSRFFVAGGTLARDAPSYIVRRADRELVDSLLSGEFCYVLTSRQMGKSSLMVRAAAALRRNGRTVVLIDLQRIGNNLSLEQWYAGLLDQVGAQLDLEDELEDFWYQRSEEPPLQRWNDALEWILDGRPEANFVIFIDEIDFVRSLPFRVDEFFAAIRGAYNNRAVDPKYNRLTYCLLGVATPAELIVDPRTTPFNIGRRIELNDFTLDEALSLTEGLPAEAEHAERVIERTIHWTDGHPYLTQRLLTVLTERDDRPSPGGIDRLCDDLFFSEHSRERDDNLLFVRDRILRLGPDLAGLLSIYEDILRGRQVPDDEADNHKAVLKLSGIVSVRQGQMQVRNRIYQTVFNRGWVRENMPDAEVRRQRRAFYRGIAVAGALGLLVAAGFAGLGAYAWYEQQRAEAHLRDTLNVLSQWTGHLEDSIDDPKVSVYVLKGFVTMMDEAGVRDMLAQLDQDSAKSRDYARRLHRSLLRIQYRAGDSQLSLKYIEERLAALAKRELTVEDRQELYWNLVIKGYILRRLARYDKALDVFDRVVGMIRGLGLRMTAEERRRLATTYLVRGETLAEFGEFERAEDDLKEAEKIYAERIGKPQDRSSAGSVDASGLIDYGRFLRSYGEFLALAGRHDDAQIKFNQAKGIYATVREGLRDTPESAAARRLERHWVYLITSENINRSQQGGDQEVPKELKAIAAQADAQAEADPEHLRNAQQAAEVNHALALMYEKAGSPGHALKVASRAYDLRQRLANRDPENAEWQRDLVESGLVMARLYEKQDSASGSSHDDITRQYQAAIGRLATLLDDDASAAGDIDVPSWRTLAKTERSYGDYLHRRGRGEEAVHHYEVAVGYGRRLLEQANDNAYWRADLAESLAGLARARWQSGAMAEALEPLSEARENRLAWLKRDPTDARRLDAFVADTKVMSGWLKDRGDTAAAERVRSETRTILTQLRDADKLPQAHWRQSIDVLSN